MAPPTTATASIGASRTAAQRQASVHSWQRNFHSSCSMNCSSTASTANASARHTPSRQGRQRSAVRRSAVVHSASSKALESQAAGEWSERKARSQPGANNQAASSR